MSADMLASVASTASAMAATAALRRAAVPPPLDAPLPLAANFLLDCEAPGHWGYLHLLAAAEKGDEAKAIWLLETLKVAPDARPDAHAPVAPGDRRSVLVAAGRLRWAVEEGATPLMVASRPPRTLPGVIRALLANGADPGLRDFHSWTALLRAAWNGREDAVRTLLQGVESRGRRVASDPDEKDRGGWTAVMRAAWNAHLPALRALLPHNPPLDARDRYGQTALILAASLGHADIVRALLEAGADPAHRDDKGQDAAAAARARGHDAAAKVLEEWAARPAATGRRVTSIYAEELPEDHLIRKPPAPAAGVPGAFVDPEPPAAQVESTPTPTPTPTATTSDPELPSDLAALHPAGDSIPPSCHAQLPPLLSELLRPRPALDAVLSRFASFERAGGEVREGVVRRMEGVRYLKEEIAAFASFAAGRAALAEKFASLQHAAEADAAARAGEVQALEEARGKLEKEAEQARGELEGLRARLVELEGSLGLPGSAAEGVHAARGEAERAFASRAAEMDAEAAVKKRELAGAERTAALAGALMTRAAEEAAALGDDGAALGRELAAAEQRHAGYLRELVARSLRVLHAIRRGLEQAGDDAAMALEMGLQARHDRIKLENRRLEEELEEARRLKAWYERCLAELDRTAVPEPDPEPEVPSGGEVRVEVAETPATVPEAGAEGSEARLPDAVSLRTEEDRPAVLAAPEQEPAPLEPVQMVDVELSSPPSLAGNDSLAAGNEPAAGSEADTDWSYAKVERAELEEEIVVREAEEGGQVEEEGKGLVVEGEADA